MTAEPTLDDATTPYRRRIAAIWSAALGIEVTAADHDFFAAGGDSFQAVLATASVRREWGVDVPAQLLLDHPVLADFAAHVARLADERAR
ncbi:phosphopantetheine-binding protein [Streptomyces griseus]|uniref:phosphopantetheine-binding protein n=1 Tax=Streptomyces griseus TaxID=1911 RepID=UPI0008405DFC|nr:phosphopantetheine-binding protein [Streptomyces griseus]